MTNDIRIWEMDDSSKAASPLESTNRMETEQSLEEVLVRNPDVLMPHLTLVGRQTQTDSGVLDLLGVDADGRLVVFELKRETLTRDAVAQIIKLLLLSGISDGSRPGDLHRRSLGQERCRQHRRLRSVVLVRQPCDVVADNIEVGDFEQRLEVRERGPSDGQRKCN